MRGLKCCVCGVEIGCEWKWEENDLVYNGRDNTWFYIGYAYRRSSGMAAFDKRIWLGNIGHGKIAVWYEK